VSVGARDEGDVVVDVVVTPPEGGGYTARGIRLRSTRRRGQGNVVGRWTAQPYVSTIGEVFDASSGARVADARVTFVRRGGVPVEPADSVRVMMTDEIGRFYLDLQPRGGDPIYADFIIERPDFRRRWCVASGCSRSTSGCRPT
jgi:hypothetical protein